MLWLMLPEVAVTVAVYVPAGVPGVVCVDGEELLPPQPTENANASTTSGAASSGRRLRFRIQSNVEPRSINAQKSVVGPAGKLTRGAATVVTGAVVATFTVTVCVPVPLIWTEEGTVQVGAGVAAGVIAQLKFTVPVKDPVPAKARVKLAVCPGGSGSISCYRELILRFRRPRHLRPPGVELRAGDIFRLRARAWRSAGSAARCGQGR